MFEREIKMYFISKNVLNLSVESELLIFHCKLFILEATQDNISKCMNGKSKCIFGQSIIFTSRTDLTFLIIIVKGKIQLYE